MPSSSSRRIVITARAQVNSSARASSDQVTRPSPVSATMSLLPWLLLIVNFEKGLAEYMWGATSLLVASPCRNCFLADEKSICSSMMSTFLLASGSKVTIVGGPDICGCKKRREDRIHRRGLEFKERGELKVRPKTSTQCVCVLPVCMGKYDSVFAVFSPGIS